MHKALTRFLLAGGLTLLALPASALDLKQAYELALKNDPTIREAEANYLAAREAKPQAWAAYLPQITGAGSVSKDDDAGTSSRFITDPAPGFAIFDDDTETDTTNLSITLRQTIFNWSRIRDISAANAEVAQAEADWQAAQQNLVVRVSEAYFNQLAAEDQLETARANREAIGRQLEQSKKRFEVGLIAVTDVQESQAAFDQATADEIAAERSLASTREALRVVIGEYPAELVKPGDNVPLQSPEPVELESWVKLARQQNLSLLSAQFGAEAANARVGSARGAHLPTLDFVAQKSRFEQDQTGETTEVASGGVTPIDTSVDNDGTSIQLQLNVPLFAGGATQSRVRQARYQARAADERYERASRETDRTARDAYLGVTSEISRVKALRQGLQSSETALKATEAGFEVGTRTTVDVLDARRRMFQAKTNYERSKYDYLLNTLRLKQAAGMLTDADLSRVNDWLK